MAFEAEESAESFRLSTPPKPCDNIYQPVHSPSKLVDVSIVNHVTTTVVLVEATILGHVFVKTRDKPVGVVDE